MSTRATAAGTGRYAVRLADACDGHFRLWSPPGEKPLSIATLGLGTYTGPATDQADREYREAVAEAVRQGVNLLDCAINYRHMRSERAVGAALGDLFASGEASRDEVVVMTKGGFLPFDGDLPPNPREALLQAYVESGRVPSDQLAGGTHCISPDFLGDQLARSLENLGLEAVDVYFVHNPEQQLSAVDPREFERRMAAAFERLEREADAGRLGFYGVATWNGLRVAPATREHLSLEWLLALAEAAGGERHRFRFVQLPYNLGMPEALTVSTQTWRGREVPFLEAAAEAGLAVVTSVPLLQTKLLAHIPEGFAQRMPGLSTAAQRAIQFVRSTPGVLAPLVGMRRRAHVSENTELRRHPPLAAGDFFRLLQR